MKGEITLKILEKIYEGITAHTDLLMAVLESGYGASSSKIHFAVDRKSAARDRDEISRRKRYAEYERYYKILSYIKKDGLVEKQIIGGKKFFKITSRGLEKLKRLKKKKKSALPSFKYQAEDSSSVIIVTFDIAEKQRKKREWIRSALKNLGFAMIQQSVWVGKKKLPKDFLRDIRDMQIASGIEVFQATKSGSLRRVFGDA